MFKKFTSALKLVKNLDSIKEIISATYIVVVKAIAVVVYIQTQINDTKLGEVLAKYIPKIVTVLATVKTVIEKYGKYIGFVPEEVVVQSSDLLGDLDRSLGKLNGLIK